MTCPRSSNALACEQGARGGAQHQRMCVSYLTGLGQAPEPIAREACRLAAT
ncbi:hypothetical protein NX801_23875 [Streptomyces sp. LP05-1]|uniref:Uncharacterized protein n=1 Tax=Streptomyces pyxinae TaxID=2970734 RepID=A0ABT2CMV3_9ACTN|nr:hypothetical protein [Streptomyces sp. LP05-1]MCS0638640.1 hypothetical protein [Streptomyces sp. LP05-1]